MARLNGRHLTVQKSQPGVDPLVDIVLSSPEGEKALSYERAKVLFSSKTKRSYVEACLLASEDLDKISDIIEVPVDVLETYLEFFYDIRGFDKLSKLELVDADRETSAMKLWALSQGLEFISWRLGSPVNISPVDGLKDLFSTCIYKSKECLFSRNESITSRESVKWVKLSMDIARLLKVWVMDSAAAKRDLELAIQEVVPDFKTIDDLDGFDVESYVQSRSAEAAATDIANKSATSDSGD